MAALLCILGVLFVEWMGLLVWALIDPTVDEWECEVNCDGE